LLLLNGNLQQIQNSGNPGEFDYKKYLNRKQIYFQCYLKSLEWKKISSDKGNPVYAFAYDARTWILSIYQSSGIKGDEFAILAALTIGVKDYLSDEIVEAYSDSGAMHVLAVSGLHVGILMAMLNMLFSFLGKRKKLRALQSIIVISFLWLFALITGLAPSVTRSALMFSFFVLGKNSGKKPSSYNSLAAAAFIILLFNPNALFHVGFQLSFLAVISILFFQQKIYRAFDIKNKYLDYFWQLTTVSIAAQIGTTPISIFYFHQFPVYALLTNIIVIPAAAIILYAVVFLLISSIYMPLAKIIALLLSYVLKFLNISTQSIEALPFSSIEHISLSKTELLLLYLAFLLFAILIITKQNKLKIALALLLIGSFGSRAYRFFDNSGKEQFIVFNSGRKSSFATISNRKMVLYADSLLSENKKSMEFLTSNIRTNNFVMDFALKKADDNNNKSLPFIFISVDTITATYLHGKTDWLTTTKKLKTDYLIFSKNATLNIENLLSLFTFKKIIIDSSVPEWKQKILKKDCQRKEIPIHNVSEEGAFVWNSSL
jgi:competence protein ComEC